MVEKFDVIVVDAYGVFNFGQGISLSVINTFKKWMEQGKKVYILSLEEYIKKEGIYPDYIWDRVSEEPLF